MPFINGVPSELKSPTVPTMSSIVNHLRGSVRGGAQAPNVVVAIRGLPLSEADAEALILRARAGLKGRLAHIRIYGDTFPDRNYCHEAGERVRNYQRCWCLRRLRVRREPDGVRALVRDASRAVMLSPLPHRTYAPDDARALASAITED